MAAIASLAERQLRAYNAADLEAFCACYHPRVRVLDGARVVAEGAEAFRATYEAKFAAGGFGAGVPRRQVRGEICVDEEHYWSATGGGSLLVEYTLREGLIGQVRFTRLGALAEALRGSLMGGQKIRVAGLGMFTPCTRKRTGCRTVMFRPDAQAPLEHADAVEAIAAWLETQERLQLEELGDFVRTPKGVVFRASEVFRDALTAAF